MASWFTDMMKSSGLEETLSAHAASLQTAASSAQAAVAAAAAQAQSALAEGDLFNLDSMQDGELLGRLNLHYLAPSLIAMGLPTKYPANECENRVQDVAALLRIRHKGRFMVWNLSETLYDTADFDGNVIAVTCPGHPSPPLGFLFKLCLEIESWINAEAAAVPAGPGNGADDPLASGAGNVAVIHCKTGRGRTAVLCACLLAWMCEEASPASALQRIVTTMDLPLDSVIIPSQRLYADYFGQVLDGERPRGDPLLLRRIIVNGVPLCEEAASSTTRAPGPAQQGCRPRFQLFKHGELLFTSSENRSEGEADIAEAAKPSDDGGDADAAEPPPRPAFHPAGESSLRFGVDTLLQGDIVCRCQHWDRAAGTWSTIFRTAFHTAFVPRDGVLRLRREQLDGLGSTSVHARAEVESGAKLARIPSVPSDLTVEWVFGSAAKLTMLDAAAVAASSIDAMLDDTSSASRSSPLDADVVATNLGLGLSGGEGGAKGRRRKPRNVVATDADAFVRSIVDNDAFWATVAAKRAVRLKGTFPRTPAKQLKQAGIQAPRRANANASASASASASAAEAGSGSSAASAGASAPSIPSAGGGWALLSSLEALGSELMGSVTGSSSVAAAVTGEAEPHSPVATAAAAAAVAASGEGRVADDTAAAVPAAASAAVSSDAQPHAQLGANSTSGSSDSFVMVDEAASAPATLQSSDRASSSSVLDDDLGLGDLGKFGIEGLADLDLDLEGTGGSLSAEGGGDPLNLSGFDDLNLSDLGIEGLGLDEIVNAKTTTSGGAAGAEPGAAVSSAASAAASTAASATISAGGGADDDFAGLEDFLDGFS